MLKVTTGVRNRLSVSVHKMMDLQSMLKLLLYKALDCTDCIESASSETTDEFYIQKSSLGMGLEPTTLRLKV